jgi:hypothetical protein
MNTAFPSASEGIRSLMGQTIGELFVLAFLELADEFGASQSGSSAEEASEP